MHIKSSGTKKNYVKHHQYITDSGERQKFIIFPRKLLFYTSKINFIVSYSINKLSIYISQIKAINMESFDLTMLFSYFTYSRCCSMWIINDTNYPISITQKHWVIVAMLVI